jgi:phage shock protein C
MENGTKEVKKLYRSSQNRVIAGVCGGVAEYLNLDPIIVRILWILLIFIGGSGILFYILSWILIPVNPNQANLPVRKNGHQVWGIILITLGVILLLTNIGLFPQFDWFEWWDVFSWGTMVSIVIIIIGALLVFNYFKSKDVVPQPNGEPEVIQEETEPPTKPAVKVLRRSVVDKKLAGVCGGLAEYLEIDSTIVRLIFILITLGSFGLGLFLYIVLAIVMPQNKRYTA